MCTTLSSINSNLGTVLKSCARTLTGPSSHTKRKAPTALAGFSTRSCDDSEDSEPLSVHEVIRELEDHRHVYQAADKGFQFGFLPNHSPDSHAYSDHGPEETKKDEPEAEDGEEESGLIASNITVDDEYKLFKALYANYGHPRMEWAKTAFSWLLAGVSILGAILVVNVSVALSCAFLGLATAIGVAYIIRPVGS